MNALVDIAGDKGRTVSHKTMQEHGQVECMVTPVAWLHDQPERYDVIHDEVKELWLRAKPKQVEHYTIPLYRRDLREPMSTDAACALLKDTLGIDPMFYGNLLKMLRAVERAHGVTVMPKDAYQTNKE